MGLFDSREKKFATLIAANADGKSLLVNVDDALKMISLTFVGTQTDALQATVIELARKIDPRFTVVPRHDDPRGGGMSTYTVSIGANAFDEVMKHLRPQLQKRSALHLIEAPVERKEESFSDLPRDVIRAMEFERSEDGERLIIIVPKALSERMTAAQKSVLTGIASAKQTALGWEFLVKEERASLDIMRELAKISVPVFEFRRKDAIAGKGESPAPLPGWIAELKTLKQQDGRAFQIVYPKAAEGEAPKKAQFLCRDSDSAELVEAALGSGRQRCIRGKVDNASAAALRARGLAITDDSQMVTLLSEAAVAALLAPGAFPRKSDRPKS